MMPLYALVFVGTTALTIVYYYSWDRMAAPVQNGCICRSA